MFYESKLLLSEKLKTIKCLKSSYSLNSQKLKK